MDRDDSRPLTRDLAPFGVRMPPELKARIHAAAEANNRSMNAEIVARLEASFVEAKDGWGRPVEVGPLVIAILRGIKEQAPELTIDDILRANKDVPNPTDDTP